MKNYRVLFQWNHKGTGYPKISPVYEVRTSNHGAAIGKAWRQYRKDFKGERVPILKVESILSTKVL